MRGCVLCGRVTFIDDAKAQTATPARTRRRPRRASSAKTR
jgi:uncharacterized protein YlaI